MHGNRVLVLVIEAEARSRKIVKTELAESGFWVRTAEGAHAGVADAEVHRPDIVILGMTMPDLSGLEVLRALRLRANVPVIMLSADRRSADAVLSL